MKKLCVIAQERGDKHPALLRAIPLAKKLKASIHFVGFAYVREFEQIKNAVYYDVDKLKASVISSRTKQLQACAKEAGKAGVKITVELVWEKNIANWLINHCKKEKQNTLLLIKSGHRSESLFHTATDQHLMRQCPVPVMIVRSKTWKKKARILAAIDAASASPTKQKLNEKVLAQAKDLADALECEMHCVFVIPIPVVLQDLDIIDGKSYAAKIKASSRGRLEQLQSQFDMPAGHCHVVSGQACRQIPKLANKVKADMVVMGTRGRAGVKASLMGNTAETTLAKLYTDIVAISP